MVLTLTEEQAIRIRQKGLSVVEYKRCVKNCINAFICFAKVWDRVVAIFKNIATTISEFADKAQYIFETFKAVYGYPTSTRYKFVKILGDLGYGKYRAWNETRFIRFARSNC